MGKKRISAWEQRAVSVLSEHFFVKAIIIKQFDSQKCESFSAVELIGRHENVLMAEYVYHFLLSQIELLLLKTEEANGRMDRSERRSYRLGVIDGFERKLENSLKLGDLNGAVVVRALEIFKKDKPLDNYTEEIYPRLCYKSQSNARVKVAAFSAGHKDGQTINLKKPISSSMGYLGRLLL